jgi:hypothetical protein
VTPEGFATAVDAFKVQEQRRRIEAMTLAFAQPGQMQPERDFNYQSSLEERQVDELDGRNGRSGAGWFSFDLPVEAGRAAKLRVTYHSAARDDANFEIQVDGKRIGQQPDAPATSGFHEVEYDIPAELTQGKEQVTVKFQANEGGQIASVFGVRMMQANADAPPAGERDNDRGGQ